MGWDPARQEEDWRHAAMRRAREGELEQDRDTAQRDARSLRRFIKELAAREPVIAAKAAAAGIDLNGGSGT